ncbi:hypothetical protein HK405_002969 [Cladochytrium tenue]|nr:hypothetical protein HK405_002969 [Cladochytrium tenue]
MPSTTATNDANVRGTWHTGEASVQTRLLGSPLQFPNPTVQGLPPRYLGRLAAASLLALGAVDSNGHPWATVWAHGGGGGFVRLVAPNVLDLHFEDVDRAADPVVQMLTQTAGSGPFLLAGLAIDLQSLDRVKIAGRLLAATLPGAIEVPMDESGDSVVPRTDVGEVRMAMAVLESLGNCPKYVNKKLIRSHRPTPTVISSSLPLRPEAVQLIGRADAFFMSSTNNRSMDTNHRGGPPGFMRVVSNNEQKGVVLVYPEYSGNRLYQSLGNLSVNPRVGIVIPDFKTSAVLYLTGEAELLVGPAAAAVLHHAQLAVRVTVSAARFVADGLNFYGDDGEPSPYNPPVRRLLSELPQGDSAPVERDAALATATLVASEVITPTIRRFTFKLQRTSEGAPALQAWKPGQHVTLDFGKHLDVGWSHMRDNDPKSLNDDFIRTFTVSSPPPAAGAAVEDGTEIQITARRNGPATGLLWRSGPRTDLQLPILGFGGTDSMQMSSRSALGSGESDSVAARPSGPGPLCVFIAGGVGITPLLAQVPGLLLNGTEFALLWSLRADDTPMALDAFARLPGLARCTLLFVTGTPADAAAAAREGELQWYRDALEAGARVEVRRMARGDVLGDSETTKGGGVSSHPRRYFLCAGPAMSRVVMEWLDGKEVASESFEY